MLRTIGFVLGKKNIGEFDREYCFFTKKYGKINLIARSVKKPLSKLTGQLEPPSLINFIFKPIEKKGVLVTALAKNSFLKIRRDFDKLKTYQKWSSLLNNFTVETHPDLKAWQLFKNSVSALKKYNWKIVDLYFLINFLKVLGLCFDTQKCVVCSKSFTKEKYVIIDFSKGGFACEKCLSKKHLKITKNLFLKIRYLSKIKVSNLANKKILLLIANDYLKINKILLLYFKYIKKYY